MLTHWGYIFLVPTHRYGRAWLWSASLSPGIRLSSSTILSLPGIIFVSGGHGHKRTKRFYSGRWQLQFSRTPCNLVWLPIKLWNTLLNHISRWHIYTLIDDKHFRDRSLQENLERGYLLILVRCTRKQKGLIMQQLGLEYVHIEKRHEQSNIPDSIILVYVISISI